MFVSVKKPSAQLANSFTDHVTVDVFALNSTGFTGHLEVTLVAPDFSPAVSHNVVALRGVTIADSIYVVDSYSFRAVTLIHSRLI